MNPNSNQPQNPRGPQFVNYGSDNKVNTPVTSQSTPPIQPTYTSRYTPPKKSHKGLFIFLFILIIIILVIAYGVYAWVLRPDNTIKTIFGNFDSAKIISTNLKINTTSEKGEQYSATLLIDLDKTNPNSLRNQTVVSIDSDKFALGLELRYLDSKLYGQITDYPKEYAQIAKSIANKWYSFAINNTKTISADNLYEKVVGSGAFTGMHFAGVVWSTDGLVRNYTIDVNPEIFNKNNTAKYENSLSQSAIPYASMASSYASSLVGNAKLSPITVSVGMFSGELKQISLSATDEKYSTKADVVLKYDGSKSQITIEAPNEAQSLNELLAGFLSPKK